MRTRIYVSDAWKQAHSKNLKVHRLPYCLRISKHEQNIGRDRKSQASEIVQDDGDIDRDVNERGNSEGNGGCLAPWSERDGLDLVNDDVLKQAEFNSTRVIQIEININEEGREGEVQGSQMEGQAPVQTEKWRCKGW